MKLSSSIVSVVLAALVALPAFAKGGPDKAALQKQLEPKLKAAQAAVAQKCGCTLTVSVDWASYPSGSDMAQIESGLASVGEAPTAEVKRGDDTITMCDAKHKADTCSKLSGWQVQYYHGAAMRGIAVANKIATCRTSANSYCGADETVNVLYPPQ